MPKPIPAKCRAAVRVFDELRQVQTSGHFFPPSRRQTSTLVSEDSQIAKERVLVVKAGGNAVDAG